MIRKTLLPRLSSVVSLENTAPRGSLNIKTKQLTMSIFYDIPSELATGLYVVEFYDEDALIGAADFELR